jgi:hypothetical protein
MGSGRLVALMVGTPARGIDNRCGDRVAQLLDVLGLAGAAALVRVRPADRRKYSAGRTPREHRSD